MINYFISIETFIYKLHCKIEIFRELKNFVQHENFVTNIFYFFITNKNVDIAEWKKDATIKCRLKLWRKKIVLTFFIVMRETFFCARWSGLFPFIFEHEAPQKTLYCLSPNWSLKSFHRSVSNTTGNIKAKVEYKNLLKGNKNEKKILFPEGTFQSSFV
jgi:hypothetical protein